MSTFQSLKKNREFQSVYRAGRSRANRLFIMFVLDNGLEDNRVGISVSKKVGNSVVRHRVARKVREETDVPIAVGFGIGSAEAAVEAAKDADAVIVGSAVVRRLMDGKTQEAEDFVASLRSALDEAY